MVITLTLANVALFILFCLILAVGVYLIIALKNVNQLVKDTNDLLVKNKANLTKTAHHLPILLETATETTVAAKESIEKVQNSINEFEEIVADTLSAAGDKVDTLGIYVNTAADIAKIVMDFVSNVVRR